MVKQAGVKLGNLKVAEKVTKPISKLLQVFILKLPAIP